MLILRFKFSVFFRGVLCWHLKFPKLSRALRYVLFGQVYHIFLGFPRHFPAILANFRIGIHPSHFLANFFAFSLTFAGIFADFGQNSQIELVINAFPRVVYPLPSRTPPLRHPPGNARNFILFLEKSAEFPIFRFSDFPIFPI